jgi:hypothetical protein
MVSFETTQPLWLVNGYDVYQRFSYLNQFQSDEALTASFLAVLDPHLLDRTQREPFNSL